MRCGRERVRCVWLTTTNTFRERRGEGERDRKERERAGKEAPPPAWMYHDYDLSRQSKPLLDGPTERPTTSPTETTNR